MIQTAASSAAAVPSRGTLRPQHAHANPRLQVQLVAVGTRRRHFVRALRRVVTLGILDLCVLGLASRALTLIHRRPSGEPLFPLEAAGPWTPVAALLLGLALVGAYASEDRWASADVILKGVALGVGLSLWQTLDTMGIPWALTRWGLIVALLGAALVAARTLLRTVLVRWPLWRPARDRVIFVGDPQGRAGRAASRAILQRPGMHSLGWLSEEGGVDDYLGHPSAVWEVLCEKGTDTVVLCGDLPRGLFNTVIEAAAVAGCRVLSARGRGTLMASQPRALNGGKLRMLELTFPAARAGQDVVKRAFDLVLATAALVLLSPLLGVLSIWIKLDSPGPVLFVQERVGQAGRVFRMLKFRTMRNGADGEKAVLTHLNHTGDSRLFKIPDDPRVTRAGAFLRHWSLDELPQLVNVLWGDMSLVGPRPFFEADLAAYDDHHFLRLAVKPGVTGLWQVRGRSSIVDFEEVVGLDREYIENWSLMRDVGILMATVPAVLRRTGAY